MLSISILEKNEEKFIEIFSGENETTLLLYYKLVERILPIKEWHRLKNIWISLPDSTKKSFVSTDFESLQNDVQNALLKHTKIKFISYPHEWCPEMFKEACIFHLHLFKEMIACNMTMNDFHLWNVLPENNNFKFVDIPSLDEYTEDVDSPENIKKMLFYFEYYLWIPLLGYKYGNSQRTRQSILNTTLNASTHVMSLRDCFSFSHSKLSILCNAVKAAKQYRKFMRLKSQTNKIKLLDLLSKMESLVNALDLKPASSDYAKYYEQKGEWAEYTQSSKWTLKQKNINSIINDTSISSVLDMGCNTGWFSILAARQGKQVVSIDNDEACISELYKTAKLHHLNILPLCLSIDNLNIARHAQSNGKKIILSFVDRIQCDLVLVLGLIHHLVLGLGYEIQRLLNMFSKMTIKKLVIEFVDFQDEMIVNYPDFFKAFHKSPDAFSFYSLENLVENAKQYFTQVEIIASHPQTRKLIVLTK